MRLLGLAFAAVLAVIVPIAAHANEPRSSIGPANAGPAARIVLVWDGNGSGRHPAPVGWGGGWHPGTGRVSQWNGVSVPPPWGPNHPYGGPAGPTYWVWGPGGGAFDYPFADWRGPHGGWGNP
jgi:hypothetical protein